MAVTTRKRPIKYRRGKQIPVLKHGDVIDLTTFPLRSKPRTNAPIEVCGRCGRKGERATLTDSMSGRRTASWTHVIEFQTIFWMVRDSCSLKVAGQAGGLE